MCGLEASLNKDLFKGREEESEFHYYHIFDKWLKNQGLKTFQSVRYKYGEIDILGVQLFKTVAPKIFTIEVKMRDWDTVIYQAHKRLSFATKSYMGLIYRSPGDLAYFMYKFGQSFKFLTTKPYRLGILIYDVNRKTVIEVLSAIREDRFKDPMKEHVLRKVGYDLSSRIGTVNKKLGDFDLK